MGTKVIIETDECFVWESCVELCPDVFEFDLSGRADKIKKGKKMLLSVKKLRNYVLKAEDVEIGCCKDSPDYDRSALVNRKYEARLYDFYGRPKYWG